MRQCTRAGIERRAGSGNGSGDCGYRREHLGEGTDSGAVLVGSDGILGLGRVIDHNDDAIQGEYGHLRFYRRRERIGVVGRFGRLFTK
jgi:hypothetical protein